MSKTPRLRERRARFGPSGGTAVSRFVESGINPGPSLAVPPPKRYKVGELAAHTGLSRQTLHNYTRWGLIQEVAWTPGGHRLYGESVFSRLAKILALKPTHTVDQIKTILDEPLAHSESAA